MRGSNYRLPAGSVPLVAMAAAGLVLSACAEPQPAKEIVPYDKSVSQWVDDTEANLVNSWGIPSKSHAMETGGRIVEYTQAGAEGKTVCTTRFTIDGNGLVRKTWFKGTDCAAPGSN